MAAVTIRGLTKRYGDVTVVDELDLDVAEGEFLTLLGPSGCGKTTTLRCVAGLERPDGGEIRIGGRVIVSSAGGQFVPPEKRDAGMVFQSYALWPHMTVHNNVAYPLRMRRRSKAEIPGLVRAALAMVGLDHLAGRSVSALSGGQQQRVALARALVAQPSLLLFDEPLSNLDAKLRTTMRTELHALHKRVGTTSIYVTHDQIEALTLSDRIVVMHEGKIHQVGTPEEIYTHPADRFVADFIGFENFLTATVVDTSGAAAVVQADGFPSVLVARGGSAAHRAGDRVTLTVRANTITLLAPADGPAHAIPAEVTAVAYLGDQVEYLLAVGPHALKVRMATPTGQALPRWKEGDRVVAVIQQEALLVVGSPAPAPSPQRS
ncbi:ABC transporter ATP-binding protein [Dactylosporangium sucinum]|uniref:ABC transporter ATP-binding protein n=1 Tax=Dactylosporangium sucinum TaxID=1424081 RepID=A0A917U919_9ACTN|nr:ABC transporter ATP-binding protein [Dactylosporangium sucinum]GGM67356.1 ABC transporter ATP-binding protein [Dactylosporangium sucinum]